MSNLTPEQDGMLSPGRQPEPSMHPDTPERGIRLQYDGVRPLVVYIMIGITVLIYLSQEASRLILGVDLLAAMGMKINAAILQGELWRLFTPIFLHGSILHLAFNMYALNALGPQLERYYGHWRFLSLYLLSGFAGNVTSFLLTEEASLGSSTAIFGIIGAYGVFLYQNQQVFGNLARRALINIVVLAGINLIIGLSPGIDNWGHLGGLVAGFLFAWFGGPQIRVEGVVPLVRLVDARDQSDTWRAGLVTAFLFLLLAFLSIIFRLI